MSAFEDELAAALGKLGARQLSDLMKYLGDPPNMMNLPADFWASMSEASYVAVLPVLENACLAGALDFLNTLTIGVDWALVNMEAANWARTYSYDLVKQINDTSRKATQQAVSSFFEQQMTMGQLRDKLKPYYGTVRAEMIATTEVTRASAEGARIVASLIEQQSGIKMKEVWQTSNDELVCPICAPRNGVAEGEGTGSAYWLRGDGINRQPPAHPRCRCGISHEYID
jgi:hypothetical protein